MLERGFTMFFRAMAGAAAATAAGLATAGLLLVPPAQAVSPVAVQLTGTQLASQLLPTSYFPSGYTIEKGSAYNSGRQLEHAAAKYNLATFSCKKSLTSGLPNTGFGETATAGSIISDRKEGFQQTVWQFASSAQAASFYKRMYGLYSRCRSVTATIGSYTARLTTQSLTKTQVGGHLAFKAAQRVTLTGFPVTLNDTLVIVAGTDVFLINAGGPTMPGKPALTTAMLHLIARI